MLKEGKLKAGVFAQTKNLNGPFLLIKPLGIGKDLLAFIVIDFH